VTQSQPRNEVGAKWRRKQRRRLQGKKVGVNRYISMTVEGSFDFWELNGGVDGI
jgi:hypothetical protein